MWKILTAASTALVLIGTPALAEWDAWDLNGDAFIDQTEFDESIDVPGLFNDIDLDDDDLLGEDEWETGVFGLYDADDDDFWDAEEFGLYEDRDFGPYAMWDADADGFLSADEFDTGIFDVYDADDDDMWGQEEFGVFEDDGWF